LEVVTTWPGWESLSVGRLGIDWRIYADIMQEGEMGQGDRMSRRHQILGWAREVQGEMQTEWAEAWAGLGSAPSPYTGEPAEPPEVAARREAARADAERWRMVLQVDSDDALGTEWGDVGRVYFWVREDSLADGSFEARWAVLQCH